MNLFYSNNKFKNKNISVLQKMITSLKHRLDIKIALLFTIGLLTNIPLNASNFSQLESVYIDNSLSELSLLEKAIESNPSDLTSFQLFSHGRPGELLIEGEWLNANEIASYLNSNFNIQNSQVETLNIFGCEFAKGEKGKQAVVYLENSLGLKVNASTNITGIDGDWILEVGEKDFTSKISYNGNLQTCGGTPGGIEPTDDYDRDGVCNDMDEDDDNDGIKDIDEECQSFISQNTDGSWIGESTSTIDVTLSPSGFGERGGGQTVVEGQDIYSMKKRGGDPIVHYTGNMEFKVTFSPGVPANEIAFYIYGFDASSSSTNGSFNVFVNGVNTLGNLFEQVNYGYSPSSVYNASNSTITSDAAKSDQQRVLIKGVGNTLITEFKVTSVTLSNGDYIAYSLLGKSYCDTDGDGIRNIFDLDSDGDGCPDAIEGDSSYTASQLVTTMLPGGTTSVSTNLCNSPSCVDANGNPIVNGSTVEQGKGNSHHYSTNTECCSDPVNFSYVVDSDGDGIGDDCDNDDDNDGILDFVENNYVNLALSGTASQSSEYYISFPASNAIDGNIDNFSHTSGEAYAWWEIDLGSVQDISFLNLYNRTAAEIRLEEYHVFISEVAFTSTDIATTQAQPGVIDIFESLVAGRPTQINIDTTARFIRIQLTSSNDISLLIAEVEIFNNPNLDFDNDGIENSLDLDSDGDGCSDALEGGDSLIMNDLVASSMPGGNTDSTGFTGYAGPVSDNLGNNVDSNKLSISYGVPTLVGLEQSKGISQATSAEIILSQPLEDTTFCDNEIPDTVKLSATVNSNPSDSAIVYQWQVSTDGGVNYTDLTSDTGTLTSDSVTTLNLTGVNTTFNGNIYKVIFTTDNSSCPVETEAKLTIVLSPSVTMKDIDTVCANADSVQLTGTPATGGVFSGTGVNSTTGKFYPATAGAGTHTLYYTYTNSNGCSTVDSATVVVKPTQAITLSVDTASSIVCGEGTFTADFSNTTPSGTQITWTSSQMSTGSGNISELLSNNTSSPKTVSYYIVAKSPNSCSELKDTINVTVNPKPKVTASACEITTCSGDSAIIDFSSTVDSTVLSWIGDNGTSGTGDIKEVLTNSGSVNDTVTYSIIGTSSNGCKSDTVSCRVIVRPNPVLQVTERSFCLQDNPTQLEATPTGGTFSGGTYVSSDGVFDPTTAGLGTHQVIYNYTDASGCVGEPDTGVIIVSKNPSVSLATNPICLDAPGQQLTVSPAGGAFSGIGVDSAGFFTPSIAGVGSHRVAYVISDGSTGCTGSGMVDIVVKEMPNIKIASAGPFCLNNESVQLQATPSGGTYSGKGVSSTGLFTPASAGAGTHTIQYLVTFNGCTDSSTIDIEVYNGPNLTVTPSSDTICSGDTTALIISGVNGASLNWSSDVFGKSGTDTIIKEEFINNGGNSYTVNFSIKSELGKCFDSKVVPVVVRANPTVQSTLQNAVICDYENLSIKLTAPLSGTLITWKLYDNTNTVVASGSGTNSAQIIRVGLSSGNYTLKYTGTINSCTSPLYILPITIN